jgi:hypothetical protein
MEWSPLCEKEVAEALRITQSWKAPGRDQISNCWLKQLTTHSFGIINWRIEEIKQIDRKTKKMLTIF